MSKKGQTGILCPNSRCYKLTDSKGAVHILYGGDLRAFCKKHNLSYSTFLKNISYARHPSIRGKNIGWKISFFWGGVNYRNTREIWESFWYMDIMQNLKWI